MIGRNTTEPNVDGVERKFNENKFVGRKSSFESNEATKAYESSEANAELADKQTYERGESLKATDKQVSTIFNMNDVVDKVGIAYKANHDSKFRTKQEYEEVLKCLHQNESCLIVCDQHKSGK